MRVVFIAMRVVQFMKYIGYQEFQMINLILGVPWSYV